MRGKIFLFLLLLCACTSGRGSKIYQIGRDPTWWPLDLAAQTLSVRGFSDELLQYIAKEEKIQIALYSAGGEALMVGLNREWADGVLSSLPPVPQTETVYDFSKPYLLTGPVLVVPASSKVTGLSDMSNSLIAVVDAAPLLTEMAQVSYLLIKPFPTTAAALAAVDAGAVQGAVVESLQAYSYLADLYDGRLKVATPPLDDQGLRLIVLKGKSEELMKLFEKGLKKAIKNGTYKELAERWELHLDVGQRSTISSGGV